MPPIKFTSTPLSFARLLGALLLTTGSCFAQSASPVIQYKARLEKDSSLLKQDLRDDQKSLLGQLGQDLSGLQGQLKPNSLPFGDLRAEADKLKSDPAWLSVDAGERKQLEDKLHALAGRTDTLVSRVVEEWEKEQGPLANGKKGPKGTGGQDNAAAVKKAANPNFDGGGATGAAVKKPAAKGAATANTAAAKLPAVSEKAVEWTRPLKSTRNGVMQGKDVLAAQKYLNKAMGFHIAEDGDQENGGFGGETRRAVKRFQATLHPPLEPTGVIDKRTWDKLVEAAHTRPNPATGPMPADALALKVSPESNRVYAMGPRGRRASVTQAQIDEANQRGYSALRRDGPILYNDKASGKTAIIQPKNKSQVTNYYLSDEKDEISQDLYKSRLAKQLREELGLSRRQANAAAAASLKKLYTDGKWAAERDKIFSSLTPEQLDNLRDTPLRGMGDRLFYSGFARKVKIEGSGKTLDMDTINSDGKTFETLDPKKYPYGKGAVKNPFLLQAKKDPNSPYKNWADDALVPFKSMAVDKRLYMQRLPSGRKVFVPPKLFIPEFVGLTLPDGTKDDGIRWGHDTGGWIKGAHVDNMLGVGNDDYNYSLVLAKERGQDMPDLGRKRITIYVLPQ